MALRSDGRRVVVTGIGMVTPIGNDRETTWQGMMEGRSGAAPITLFDASAAPVRFACEVKGFDPVALLGHKEARRTSRPVQLAVAAAREAVADSGIDLGPIADRAAVIIGSGVGGLALFEKAVLAYAEGGYRKVSAFAAAGMLVDMPAGMVAADVGARGPNFAIVSACCVERPRHRRGGRADPPGRRRRRPGRGDGGVDHARGDGHVLRDRGPVPPQRRPRGRVPTLRPRPRRVRHRGGGRRPGAGGAGPRPGRGARIYGELVGYGATADAAHITQPDPSGIQAARCMHPGPGDGPVGRPTMSATSTPTAPAPRSTTRPRPGPSGWPSDAVAAVPVSSTKSMTGHLSGAAGALEAMVTLMAIHDRFLPPTINLDHPDPECDLDHVALVGRPAPDLDLALSTSFGFGGHNACLVFKKFRG